MTSPPVVVVRESLGRDGRARRDTIASAAGRPDDINTISSEPVQVDILVRNVDEDTARRLKDKAKANGASVSDTVREMIKAGLKPSKEEAWAAADAIRKRSARCPAIRRN
jgi:plasmid stability protein